MAARKREVEELIGKIKAWYATSLESGATTPGSFDVTKYHRTSKEEVAKSLPANLRWKANPVDDKGQLKWTVYRTSVETSPDAASSATIEGEISQLNVC